MKRFEASKRNVFCQETLCLLSRCILALHDGTKALSQRAKMVGEIEPILKLEVEHQNVVNVAAPEVRGHLHDMGFLLADIEDNLARLQLDVSEFTWRAGLVVDGLRGLKSKRRI